MILIGIQVKKPEGFEEFPEKYKKLFIQILNYAGEEARSEMLAKTPRDTGRLYAGYKHWLATEVAPTVVISNAVEYAGIMEYGSKPFTPPIKPLVGWVHRKFHLANPYPVARAIQKKISMYGLKGHGFFTAGQEKASEILEKDYSLEIEKLWEVK